MENLEEADKFLEVQSPKTELGRNKKMWTDQLPVMKLNQ